MFIYVYICLYMFIYVYIYLYIFLYEKFFYREVGIIYFLCIYMAKKTIEKLSQNIFFITFLYKFYLN